MKNLIEALELLFDHPQEYIFLPRGSIVFDVPKSFYPPRLIDRADTIMDQFDRPLFIAPLKKLYVRDIKEPNLDFAANYGRRDSFCLFNPNDRAVSTKLITMLMELENVDDFVSLATYIRDRLNPFLFQYVYSVAVQHRRDTMNIKLPSVVAQFPSNFIEPSTLEDAKEEARLVPNSNDLKVAFEVPLNYTASDREEEQRMAYFREDIGINMHHWHWHLVFPNNGPIDVVRKDRRGELFMYMHNQIIARYNLDRFCNDLGKTIPLGNLRDPIPEGYYPKLLESVSSRTYPARMPGQTLHDMNRPDLIRAISDLERWTDRILSSIDRGYVFDPSGKAFVLDEKTGIDLLGNIIESSSLSLNPQFYGDLHNQGHLIISYIHDPDLKYLEDYSVMGDTTTAMRDPIFYRWHTFIDNLGAKHKALLPPYGAVELQNEGIIVREFNAICKAKDSEVNTMRTFWKKSDVDIGVNLDFSGRPKDGLATFRFTHLWHEPFEYRISVMNNGDHHPVTCRIFLLPRDDERLVGLTLEEQRLLAVELDRFSVLLMPGPNFITRQSTESSVTVPFTSIFKPKPDQHGDPMDECLKSFCSCGWPSHMLLPKGTAAGKIFKLFVMLSNDFDDSMGPPHPAGIHFSKQTGKAFSFCGLKDQKYPDQRSMGFPFDRKLPALRLDGLLQQYANMKSCDLKIVFDENGQLGKKQFDITRVE